MPFHKSRRGGTGLPSTSRGVHRPSPFASAGKNSIRAPSLASKYIDVPESISSGSVSKKKSITKGKGGSGSAGPDSPGSGGSRSPPQSYEYVEKINFLSETVNKQKKEKNKQEIVLNGLKRNLDVLTSNAHRDRRTIETLRRELKVLKEGDGMDLRSGRPDGSVSAGEREKIFEQIDALKSVMKTERDEFKRKTDALLKTLKDAQNTNALYCERVKQFEQDLLSKSSTEVTFKKQMETVSSHAKRMVDENRLLKEKLKHTDDQEAKINELRSKNDGLGEGVKRLTAELQEAKVREMGYEAKVQKMETTIERLKGEVESAHKRRKRAVTDLSSQSSHLAQAKNDIALLNGQIISIKKEQGERNRIALREKNDLLQKQQQLEQGFRACEQELLSWKCQHAAAMNQTKLLERQLISSKERTPELEKRIKEVSRRYEVTLADRDLFSQQLETLQRESKQGRAKMEKENASYKSECERMKTVISDLQSEKKRIIEDWEQKLKRATESAESSDKNLFDKLKKAHIQVEGLENQVDSLVGQVKSQSTLTSTEQARADRAGKQLKQFESTLEEEKAQSKFLQKELERQRASSASESERADKALGEALRCRESYMVEHDRAKNLANELSELRHAHLKLSEKLKKLQLGLESQKNSMNEHDSLVATYEKQRDVARAALSELKNAMKQADSKFASSNEERLRLVQQIMDLEKQNADVSSQYEELKQNAKDAEKNARLAKVLKLTEKELKNTVAKLLKTEEATESAFTCLSCMNLFDKPVTCIPCGHSFCEKCVDSYRAKHGTEGGKDECPECAGSGKQGGKVDYFISNELLENLSSRFVFRKQALQGLQTVVAKLQ
eukprot:g6912.t1